MQDSDYLRVGLELREEYIIMRKDYIESFKVMENILFLKVMGARVFILVIFFMP